MEQQMLGISLWVNTFEAVCKLTLQLCQHSLVKKMQLRLSTLRLKYRTRTTFWIKKTKLVMEEHIAFLSVVKEHYLKKNIQLKFLINGRGMSHHLSLLGLHGYCGGNVASRKLFLCHRSGDLCTNDNRHGRT